MHTRALAARRAPRRARPCSPRWRRGCRGCRASALSAPSCIAPPRESVRSSSCSAIVPPHSRWRWSASRSTPAFATGCPSSVKPPRPARAARPSSVSRSPSRPRVSAARLPTGTCACRGGRLAHRAQQLGGVDRRSVLGIAITAPNPPAAAARVPLSMSSLCSCPGLRRCTCGSKKAGSAYRRPSPSTISSFPAAGPAGSVRRRASRARSAARWPRRALSRSKRPSTPRRRDPTRARPAAASPLRERAGARTSAGALIGYAPGGASVLCE